MEISNSERRLASVLEGLEERLGGNNKAAELPLSPDEIRFRSLIVAFENKKVSFSTARIIVGGRKRLMQLISDGKVRSYKPDGPKNTSWKLNAVDCFLNIRPRKKELLERVNDVIFAS